MSRDLATLLAASFKAASEEQGEWSPEFVRNFLTTLVLDAPPEALRAATLAAQEARMPGDILVALASRLDGFANLGIVRITGWEIDGDIHFSRLNRPIALNLLNCRVSGAVDCEDCDIEFVRLQDTVVGQLILSMASVRTHVKIDGCRLKTISMNSGTVEKSIVISSTQIENDVDFEGIHSGGMVIFDGMKCLGKVSLINGVFAASVTFKGCDLVGELVSLDGAAVKGSVRFSDCDLHGASLALGSMNVDQRIDLQMFRNPPQRLFLSGSATDTYKEDGSNWPAEGNLYLDRFSYRRISVEKNNFQRHLEWLSRQPKSHLSGKGFRQFPWTQLIRYLRQRGGLNLARKLAINQKDRMLFSGTYGFELTPLYLFMCVICRYGMQPWLPVLWLLALVGAGEAFYRNAFLWGYLTIRDADPNTFDPLVYAIGAAIPGVGDQRVTFTANGADTGFYLLNLFFQHSQFISSVYILFFLLMAALITLSFSGTLERSLFNDPE